MQSIGLNDWERWRRQGCRWVPAARVERGVPLPVSWATFSGGPVSVLLESARSGRYTFVCDDPARVVLAWAGYAEVWSGGMVNQLERRAEPPLAALRRLLEERHAPALPDWPPMAGGIIGVFGYDLVHTWERLAFRGRRDLALPLCAAVEPRQLYVYDHAERTLGALVWSEIPADAVDCRARFQAADAAAGAALERWRTAGASPGAAADDVHRAGATPPASFDDAGFEAAVRQVQEYIAAGHTYQVNLSLRESRATDLPPVAIYDALRQVNPSPYMGLFRLPAWALVCGSPELLVRVVAGVVTSRPIAGTRPRGAAPPADRRLSAELLASEKERAEHLMLVDLIRNDIGRVARFGSVHVADFMALERYSHVMHLVSQVEGRLADGCHWTDVLRAMFPGGTITGCPKHRTMELIEEIEPVGRGFYTGALGWINYAGDMELNIVIRSMLVQDGVAHVQAGAGIVADSRPDRELDEARRKAQALWLALENAAHAHA